MEKGKIAQLNKEEELTPRMYFDLIKSKKETITDQDLVNVYENCIEMINKFEITGQINGLRKMMFHIETIEKEREIVKLGIDTFVYKDDIEEFIDNVSDDAVKIIEIEKYERDIPDEIVEIVSKVKNHFDKLYVLFTDYTGRVERQIEKERRDKDPILFGTFQNQKSRTIIERFYYLGDWEDEYCDLTLDKMVNQIKDKTGENVVRKIATPKNIEELKFQLNQLDENDRNTTPMFVQKKSPIKDSFIKNVKTFLSGKK